jgi:ribosomal protein S18 acetylase RimI-like enzyme
MFNIIAGNTSVAFIISRMAEIINADNTHIAVIAEIAEITWSATYSTLLTPDAMRYMLDTLYSHEELRRMMENGTQKFLIVKDNHGFQGFASYGVRKEDPAIYKLHKIYVLPGNQGKGYGKLLMEEVKNQVGSRGGTMLDLNVNRQNPAQEFYKKLGFRIIRQEDVPIGQYFMTDYVMRLELTEL